MTINLHETLIIKKFENISLQLSFVKEKNVEKIIILLLLLLFLFLLFFIFQEIITLITSSMMIPFSVSYITN
jgi:hypothetical protein